jgi:carbon starvation protein
MNILPVITGAYSTLAFGYHILKKSITSIVKPNDAALTPAHQKNDQKDYVPTRPLVLFGHHWMSIAGTSPIIASIVGLLWGWGPALLWMVFGVLLVGGVHDYFALMISVRREGKSMGDVISERLGRFSGILSSIVLAFGGILVYAIFLSVIATTLAQNPTAAIPTLALIPIAILCGVLFKKGIPITIATIIGLALTLIFVILGIKYPLQQASLYFFGKEIILFSESFWIYFFVIYTFFAVYTPVWLLLQPRDYLNSAVLLIGLILGIIGLLIGRPKIQMPFFHGFTTSLRGPLWPMLFATISCGAASGWHSLIAAGTTSKQISKESHGFRIAYGGMIGETVMAVLSACLIITGFTYKEFLATGLKSSSIGVLFSQALGQAMAHLGIPLILGSTLGALALAALTLTTLDSFARTSRYVIQELGRKSLLSKPLASSIFVTLAGFLLYRFVPFMDLWNGLVLAGLLVLILPFTILSLERLRKKEKRGVSYFLHVIFPITFLYPTTFAGLIYLLYKYVVAKNWVSAFLNTFLIILAMSLIIQYVKRMKELKAEKMSN